MFNFFDLALLVVVAVSACVGFRTGFVLSLFCTGSGFVGLWSARASGADGILFYAVFTVVMMGTVVAGLFVRDLVRWCFLNIPDRLAGGVTGLALGAVAAVLLIFPATRRMPPVFRETAESSYSGTHVIPLFLRTFPRVALPSADRLAELFPGLTDGTLFRVPVPEEAKGGK